MGTAANRQIICESLLEAAKDNRDIVVLCSDSRGSASLAPFAEAYPAQFVEIGIAEQNLVSVAAGLAASGKRPFAASPACFLSTRSMEQVRVDVAYSGTNVKLIGISGGVSYGALGMTHHSAQDIAALASIPGLRVYLPSDRHQTKKLMAELVQDDKPAYVRVGRNAVPDVYTENDTTFIMDKATTVKEGSDLTLIACGEMVYHAKAAAEILEKKGINCRVLDMYCVKPLDTEAVIKAAKETRAIVCVEEHAEIGGLGAMVCQLVAQVKPRPVKCLGLPDCPPIAGTSAEVFEYYGLTAPGIAKASEEMLLLAE